MVLPGYRCHNALTVVLVGAAIILAKLNKLGEMMPKMVKLFLCQQQQVM
jgi:hypothetical protein